MPRNKQLLKKWARQYIKPFIFCGNTFSSISPIPSHKIFLIFAFETRVATHSFFVYSINLCSPGYLPLMRNPFSFKASFVFSVISFRFCSFAFFSSNVNPFLLIIFSNLGESKSSSYSGLKYTLSSIFTIAAFISLVKTSSSFTTNIFSNGIWIYPFAVAVVKV